MAGKPPACRDSVTFCREVRYSEGAALGWYVMPPWGWNQISQIFTINALGPPLRGGRCPSVVAISFPQLPAHPAVGPLGISGLPTYRLSARWDPTAGG